MKLILAIVPEKESPAIVRVLMDAEYRATIISATGGFLRTGHSTLLLGVQDQQVEAVLKQIQIACLPVPVRGDSAVPCARVFVLSMQEHRSL